MKTKYEIMIKAVKRAAALAKRHIGKVGYELKGRSNLVTAADIACQKEIVKIISKAFPDHAFLAEEKQSGLKKEGRYVWVIDPIDGTTNYAHTFAHSAVSVALTDNGEPIMGAVMDIFKGELFTAVKGKGAKLNGKKIKVSSVGKLKDSLLITGFPYDRAPIRKVHIPIFADFLFESHDVRRSGSAALDCCWIACGRADGYWEFSINPWDCCAGTLIIKEAGGKVTDCKGREFSELERYGAEFLGSNGKIHKEMLKIINKTLGCL